MIQTLLKTISHKIKLQGPVFPVICSALFYLWAALSILKIYPSFQYDFMTHEQRTSWDIAYDILDGYSAEGEILVSMLLSEYCLENNIGTSNYGQAEYNNSTNLEAYNSSKIYPKPFLFRHADDILQKNISYNQSVKDKLYQQTYACVAIVYAGEYHLADEDFINAGYHILTTADLKTGGQNWHTVFYIPNA